MNGSIIKQQLGPWSRCRRSELDALDQKIIDIYKNMSLNAANYAGKVGAEHTTYTPWETV